jgi:hypothetical protein
MLSDRNSKDFLLTRSIAAMHHYSVVKQRCRGFAVPLLRRDIAELRPLSGAAPEPMLTAQVRIWTGLDFGPCGLPRSTRHERSAKA